MWSLRASQCAQQPSVPPSAQQYRRTLQNRPPRRWAEPSPAPAALSRHALGARTSRRGYELRPTPSASLSGRRCARRRLEAVAGGDPSSAETPKESDSESESTAEDAHPEGYESSSFVGRVAASGDLEFPLPTFEDVSMAWFRIRDGIQRTQLIRSEAFSARTGCEVFLKCEYLQKTGSFKERGARNALLSLSDEQQRKGVAAASAGNHALGLAFHGKDLNIPVTVVMPENAPLTKKNKCIALGANVLQYGTNIAEAAVHANEICERDGLMYINGFDHPNIISGAGTTGIEILEDLPDVDAIVVPVGGGGLIAGIALAVKKIHPDTLIIGVEPELCASFSAALEAGGPVLVPLPRTTLADGLAVPRVGPHSFAVAKDLVDEIVQVSEKDVSIAILRLVEEEKLIQEGAGAAGVAALLTDKITTLKKGMKVCVMLCGGNIDTPVLGRVIERGLASDNRLVRFSVIVSDRPGGIAALCNIILGAEASVRDITHERAWISEGIDQVEIMIVAETSGLEHRNRLFQAIEEQMTRQPNLIVRWGMPLN